MARRTGNPLGQPTLLDARRHKILINAIRKGKTRVVSASLAGIDRSTLYEWIARGRKGEQPYADFVDDLKKAELESESDLVDAIQKATKKTWTAAAWMLERRKPKTWGRKDRVEHKMPDLSKMTIEQLTALARELRGDEQKK